MEFLDHEFGYDPSYPMDERDRHNDDNRPVDTDDWANEDLEGE